MNMPKRILTILLVLLMTCLPGPSTMADESLETLMYEDFSKCDLEREFTDDLNNFQNGNISIYNGELKLGFPEGNTTSRTVRLYPSFPASLSNDRIVIEFTLRLEGAMESRQFGLRDSANRWYYPLCIYTDGKAAIGINSGSNTGFQFENGQPYRIKLDFNKENGGSYTDVYIENAYIGRADAPSEWNDKLKYIYFLMQRSDSGKEAGEMSSTYIDELKINLSPERFYINTEKSVDISYLEFLNNEKPTAYLTGGTTSVVAEAKASPGATLSLILARYKKGYGAFVLSDISVSSVAADRDGRARLRAELSADSIDDEFIKLFIVDNLSALTPFTPVTYLFPRPESDMVAHPIEGAGSGRESYLTLIGIEERDRIKSESKLELESYLSPYMALSEAEFKSTVADMLKYKPYLDQRASELLLISERLGNLYGKTYDEAYARCCAIALCQMAENYEERARLYYDGFFGYMNIIPSGAVYAYDMIYNSGCFSALSAEYGFDVRARIEDYFYSTAMDMYWLYNEKQLTNISVYGIRSAFLVAATLNAPELIRLYIGWIDKLMGGEHFYADGMWEEGTVDYHRQVVEGIMLYVNCLNSCYSDSPDYWDPILGIRLPDSSIFNRWEIFDEAKTAASKMRYPNGDKIPVNDTDALPSANPIDEKYLANIELPAFKHYSLSGGDSNEALSISLSFDAQATFNGHNHLDYLNMTLWGAGSELLPDSGYPRGGDSEYTRFFKTPHAHNTAWVWSKAADYSKSKDSKNASMLLAYDDGLSSGKDIQLIEASQTGQGVEYVDTKQRALMLVRLEGNRFYAVDLWRLRGGDAHELYLRSSEDEAVTIVGDGISPTGYANLQDYLEATGNTGGLATINGVDNPRLMCTDPQTIESEGGYHFTWQGVRSGSLLNVYQNVPEGTESIFSEIPSLRREGEGSVQLYRRRITDSSSVTKFASVYEPVREGGNSLIKSVEWEYPDDSSSMTIAMRVKTEDFTDIIYISDDYTERTAFGAKFSAKYAFVRLKNDSVQKGYIYSGGNIFCGAFSLQGKAGQAANITATISGGENYLILDSSPEVDIGKSRVLCFLGDNYGYGYKICEAEDNKLYIDSIPAFEIKGGRAYLSFHDGLYVREGISSDKYTYTMLGRREFDNARAYIVSSTYIKN